MTTAGNPSAAKLPAPDKFTSEKSVHDSVTVLTMRGTLNEGFEGRKLADSVKTKSVVIDMREVRRLASWGMSEWMDFLKRLEQHDVYLVECSTYAVSQLTLVTGLLGTAKLVSFYAAYRCGSCGTPGDSQILVPRDREVIPELPSSAIECRKCNGAAHIEEYPAAFFDSIAARDAFDIADDVLAFLRTRYKYDLAADVTRFRAMSATQGTNTYVRISGRIAPKNLDKIVDACRNTTILDLEQVIFNPADIESWRTLLGGGLAQAKSMQVLHCPAGFLAWVVDVRQLTEKLKIRSFVMPYECLRCAKSTPHLIDVAENLEQLVMGMLPTTRCAGCTSAVAAIAAPALNQRLRVLPARDRDQILERFITKSRALPPAKLENVLIGIKREAAPPSGRRTWLVLGTLLILALLGGIGWFSVDTWRKQSQQRAVVVQATPDAGPARPIVERPEWITAVAPASAYCHDMINRLICVGISPYRKSRDEATLEANDAALEELVHTVGLRISDDFFKEHIASRYAESRSKKLSALYAVETDRASEPYQIALGAVTTARKRVVEALRASAVAAVPAQRTDWHWEEYAGESGKPNEQLVFVRYDVGLDTVRALVDRYSNHVKAKGATFVTVFPGISWESTSPITGGMVVKPARWLPLEPMRVIQGVGGTALVDAVQLGKSLEETRGRKPVELTVAGTNGPEQLTVKP